ncbi:MAG: IS1380 family transposase [Verrucomicrobiota bacterium]|nr:IS1380 family transposase [Verrucomicrobiota bacterium]MDP7291301.1 IS1380 family transposase [Verrucomicrobiota bacterium]MEE1569240.1 IS1380 family transposase [Alphaproteobacteria bacterium]
MAHPTGEAKRGPLRVGFDRRLKLEFHGSQISTDAGLLPYRELDEVLGLSALAGEALLEVRQGKNTRHLLTGLLRQSVFGRLAGYEDVNDAERLSRDPVMRAIVDRKGLEGSAASSSQMGRFETAWLASDDNLAALIDLSGAWIDRARSGSKTIILDIDSSVSPTHGEQEGSSYNGHFGCTCYHPLFVFNQFGDLERCTLRPGHVHSAEGWRELLEPVVARYQDRAHRRYFRADAAFASPEVYEYLEAEGFLYAIRLPSNQVLQRRISHLLTRPVGRPPQHVRRYYFSFDYQAHSWDSARRVVAKIEWHPGLLIPTVGFIVTNLNRPAERVSAFYNQRGKAEQWIKEGKHAINWTRLSCRKFRNNEVRLQLHALAYNLANFMRTLALPRAMAHWSLTTLREKLVKIGARMVRHGRYITFQLAEVAVSGRMFGQILARIARVRAPPVPA